MKLTAATILLLTAGPLAAQPAVEPEPVSMEVLEAPLEIDPRIATDSEADRSDELKALMEKAIAAARRNDLSTLSNIAAGLTLPNASAWFTMEFGERKSRLLQRDYQSRQFKERLPRFFRQMVADGSTQVRVTCIGHSDDKQATAAQRLALKAMTEPVKLYSIRFVRPGDRRGFHVASFAYVEGQFRCIGRLGAFAEE